jgi:putative phosphoesterase
MRILVISDTHMPRVAQDFPVELYDQMKLADMIMHAGDFIDEEVLDKIKSINKEVYAVYGNMDSPGLRRRLKDKEIVNVGKFKIGLIHGFGAPRELINTVRGEFGAVDAIVFGHAHETTNIENNGILFFNPGSPTDTIFAKERTYGILDVSDKKITGTIMRLR